jgi:ethanolamine utilization protein EutQ (cupin superfamily)
MEPHRGVFVSSVDTDDWHPDPDVPGSEFHELCNVDGVWAGLSRFVEGEPSGPWTPPVRETIVILEGAVRIDIDGGPTLDLKVGDIASLPAGLPTVWHVTRPFKEMFVLA